MFRLLLVLNNPPQTWWHKTMTLLCPWVPCVWNSGTADAPRLSSMVSGGWTGKIRRLEGEQGSDVKAVDRNLLEKS